MGKALWYGGGVQFFDDAGDPLAGGFIYTYEPGTTTPKVAYQDSDLSTPHANPIVLDAYGRPPSGQIWFDGDTKALVYDADSVLITNTGGDNLNPDAEGFGSWADKNSGVLTKTAAYTVTSGDDGKLIVATSGTWTLTLPAAASVGDGFTVDVLNSGSGVITIDGDSSETINGSATLVLKGTEGGRLFCDGSNWHSNRMGGTARLATGTYTGDGATSLAITGVGFAPKYVKIWPRITADTTATSIYETTDTIIDDNAAGQSFVHLSGGGHQSRVSGIIALGTDGFTVDDAGADSHPNTSGSVYNYLALG